MVLFHQYPEQTSGDAWLDSLDSFFGLDNVLVNSLVATINVSFKICQKGQELDERIFNFFIANFTPFFAVGRIFGFLVRHELPARAIIK